MDNIIEELVNLTKTVKSAEIRIGVLREEVMTSLQETNSSKIEFKDGSKVSISNRKVSIKRIPLEDRVDPDMVYTNSKEIYALQKLAFMANLQSIIMSCSEEMRIPSPDLDSSEPTLMVRTSKTKHNSSFKKEKLGQKYKSAFIDAFLDLYYIGKKYGILNIENAWEQYLEDVC